MGSTVLPCPLPTAHCPLRMNPVQLEHVVVARGANRALDDLNLSLGEGVSLGLVGPNGSGKSTLLRVLAGLVRPTAGRALVCGFDTREDATAVRRRIGYVPEQFGVYPRLSITQYLEFFAKAAGVSPVGAAQHRRDDAAGGGPPRPAPRRGRGSLAAAPAAAGARPRAAAQPADPIAGRPTGRARRARPPGLVEVLKEVRGMGVTMLVAPTWRTSPRSATRWQSCAMGAW